MNSEKEQKEQEEREAKGEFEQKWRKEVEEAAKIARWQEDLQGLHIEDYRETLTYNEEQDFLERLGDFLKEAALQGKTVADFRNAVKELIRKESAKATEYDEVQFYKEAEEANEALQFDQNRVFSDPEVQRKIIELIHDTGLPLMLKVSGKEDKFQKNLSRILEIYDEVDACNIGLDVAKRNLSELEKKLVAKRGTPQEEKIRATITKQQNLINEEIQYKTRLLLSTSVKFRRINNALLQVIRRKLQEESRIISKEWGGKVNTLFHERSALIQQLSTLSAESTEHFDKRHEIMQRIEEIEIELEKIKKELIDYKSKKLLFHFERMLGVQSIPVIYRYGQTSSLEVERLR